MNPNSDAMPAPELVGDRYQLYGEIARGGMGAVLRGRDVDLGRTLAVKVLLGKYADHPEVARRFLEEAQIGGQLQHPNVVPVYDVGRFGDRPFFTMKLVKGRTLAQLLAARAGAAEDRPRLLSIALQVCQAMAYAHAKGVIHRDLKPANVMVGAFGEVQVMDWGLAKVLNEDSLATEDASSKSVPPEEVTAIRTNRSSGQELDTESGQLMGTLAYAPPEQVTGELGLVDRRADVFGLGAILCVILTGHPPYVGRTHNELYRKAAHGDLAEAWAWLDGCGADQELIALTKACLAPEVFDRPEDAQAVAEGLQAYLDGVQERLRQAELAEAEARARAVEEAKRRRVTLALAATVVVALTLGGGGWQWVKADRDARQAKVTREVNEALNRVTELRERSKTGPGGAALLAHAREQAQRAVALVENGPVDTELAARVREVQGELEEEEKDRILVAALGEARINQAQTLAGANRFAKERAVPAFRAAFDAYGLRVGQGGPEAAAQRIRQRPEAVREAIVAALHEWDDLAGNSRYQITEPQRDWVRAVLEAAEPQDSWTRQVRAAREETDRAKRQAAFEALAEKADASKLPAPALTWLAWRLRPPQAVKLLRRAQKHHPGDFWVNHDLGIVLQKVTPPEWDEAVRFLTVAVALRPDSPGVHLNLGVPLDGKGQWDEAIACYQTALAVDPKDANAHTGLGNALAKQGRVDAAIASYRQALAVDPKDANAHYNLGVAQAKQGRVDAAIASYRQALAVDPKFALAHCNLGVALEGKGEVDAAIASYRKAIALDPKDANAHYNLGHALYGKGEVDAAIAAIASYRKAIALDPNYAQAHCNLGFALQRQGRFADALAAFRRGHELGSKQPGWRYPSADWVRHAEWSATLEAKLPAFLEGRFRPADTAERLGLAGVCWAKKFHRAAAGLSADAFAAEPGLADDLKAAHRYNAACRAASAAGQGADAVKLTVHERLALRRQALTWLRADLALWTKQLHRDRTAVLRALRHWQRDPDLTSLRDPAALATLSPEERQACQRLWMDVATLLHKAEAPANTAPKP